MGNFKYYVVHKGNKPGVYDNWADCKKQINNRNSVFKGFNDANEAHEFLQNGPANQKTKTKSTLKTTEDIDETTHNLYVYTDGSCHNNGKQNAYGGYGVHFSEQFDDISERIEGKVTNNIGELSAILHALKTVYLHASEYDKIYIITDSKYCIDCLTRYVKGWKKNGWLDSKGNTIKNKELIIDLYGLVTQLENLEFIHINSHTGKKDVHSLGNERADTLANKQ